MSDTKWVAEAKKNLGLSEVPGSGHNPRILAFYKESGFPNIKNDETAWCAAFVNAMLARSGKKGTGTLAARSFLNWGDKLTGPRPGAVVVFKRGNSAWQGHVGFVEGMIDAKRFRVISGNTANKVAFTEHKVTDSNILGYRWPSSAQLTPTTKKGAAATAGGAVVAGGAAAAAQAGWDASQIIMLIAGVTIAALIIFSIVYKKRKGQWPWTGQISQAQFSPTLQKSEPSLAQLSEAQLELQSAALQAPLSPPPSVSKKPRKQSAKPSRKTQTQRKSSKGSKASGGKKSSRRRK